MIFLVFIISFFIMNIVNKCILKEKNIILALGISILSMGIFFKFGLSIEFFKFSILALVLATIGWIDFKTQDVYTFHIIIGCLIGLIFIGIEFFISKGISLNNILSFALFIVSIIIIGIFDIRANEEKWIYISMICIYLLYFVLKGDINFINIFSACIIPSLVIGALALAGAMGWGDVEIIFMCGLFLDFKMSLVNLFMGILLGGLYSIYLIIFKKKKGKTSIAFGPYIALGTGVTVLLGEQILNWYINFI